MDIETNNPAEIRDDVFVYVPGFGETTAGARRGRLWRTFWLLGWPLW